MSETKQIDPAVISCAKMLDGLEYPVSSRNLAFPFAKQEGLVIVHGASDDTLRFDGQFEDEAYVEDGSVVVCSGTEVLPLRPGKDGDFWVNQEDAVSKLSDCEKLVKDFEKAFHITVKESEGADEPYWSYELKTYAPCEYETFNLMEDGAVYCQGIVFNYNESIGIRETSV